MKKLGFIPFILIALLSSAQENFLPGYIVLTEGDSVRGYIDYRNWKGNPTKIAFRKELTSESSIYDPGKISSFSVGDEIYESAQVEIEVSSTNLNDLSTEAEFKIEEDLVFLQCIVRGEKSLYALLNRKNATNLYIKNNNGFELLLYKQYTQRVNGLKQAIKNNRYQGQLALYLRDCSDIAKKFSTTRYTAKDLRKLFISYYECVGKSTDFKKSSEKTRPEFSVLAGISRSSLKFSESNYYPYLQANYDPSLSPTAGISLNLVLPRNMGRFSINNELLYTSYKIEGVHESFSIAYTRSDITFKATQLKINTLVRVKFPINQTNLRIEAGMANAFAIALTNENVQFTRFGPQETTTTSEAVKDPRKYEQGLVAGVGTSYKKFSLDLRYERGNGMSTAVNRKSTITRLYFMVGYRISK